MQHFKHPSNIVVSAASQSGKTHFTIRLLKAARTMFDPPPEEIIWCYSVYQRSYAELREEARFTDIVPKPESFSGERRTLLVLDDLMHELNQEIEQLFTKISHHKNLSIIYITQNLFSKAQRTISLNSHYFILFRNIRDSAQVSTFARQMYPSKRGHAHFMESYKDATGEPFGYILIDLRPETEDRLRLKTGILPGQTCYVYVQK
jgi:hypothetical protein